MTTTTLLPVDSTHLEALSGAYLSKLDSWLTDESSLASMGFPGPYTAALSISAMVSDGTLMWGVSHHGEPVGLCYAFQAGDSYELHCSILEPAKAPRRTWVRAIKKALSAIFMGTSCNRVYSFIVHKRAADTLVSVFGAKHDGCVDGFAQTPEGRVPAWCISITKEKYMEYLDGFDNK